MSCQDTDILDVLRGNIEHYEKLLVDELLCSCKKIKKGVFDVKSNLIKADAYSNTLFGLSNNCRINYNLLNYNYRNTCGKGIGSMALVKSRRACKIFRIK